MKIGEKEEVKRNKNLINRMGAVPVFSLTFAGVNKMDKSLAIIPVMEEQG